VERKTLNNANYNNNKTIMPTSDSAYQQWIDDTSIEAPKVHLSTTLEMERGLFALAAETIYEGERIMFIPSTCLIDQDVLKKRGSYVLNREESVEGFDDLDDEVMEDFFIGMIEELKLLLLDESSIINITARQVQYQWRGDDAVALYLIACRHILQSRVEKEPEMKQTEVPDVFQRQRPILVEAVVTEEGNFGSEDLPFVEAVQEEVFASASPIVESMGSSPVAVDANEDRERSPSFLRHVEKLPESFPNSPLYFSPDELRRIEGTNCHGLATRMVDQIELDYIKLAQVLRVYNQMPTRRMRCKKCQEEVEGTCWCHALDCERIVQLTAYKWALCNIYSRSTDFEWDEGNGETRHRRVIAPLFDMMNHADASDVSHAMDSDGNISVFNGSKAIQPGQQIFLNYGNFPNEKFLLVYGFVTKRNPFDVVQIYAPLSPSDPLYQVKARVLLSRCGIQDVNAPHPLVHIGGSIVLPPNLLAVLRLMGAQSIGEIMTVAGQEETGVGMISLENEASALQALHQALHAMARQLALNMQIHHDSPTPMQARSVAAAEERLVHTINLQNANFLCQSEYRILQDALAEIADRLSVLKETAQGYQ
jgi:hypothetical protein